MAVATAVKTTAWDELDLPWDESCKSAFSQDLSHHGATICVAVNCRVSPVFGFSGKVTTASVHGFHPELNVGVGLIKPSNIRGRNPIDRDVTKLKHFIR